MKVLLDVAMDWIVRIMWIVAIGSLANAALAIFQAYTRSLGV